MLLLENASNIPGTIHRLRVLADCARLRAANMRHAPCKDTVLRVADSYEQMADGLQDVFRRSYPAHLRE